MTSFDHWLQGQIVQAMLRVMRHVDRLADAALNNNTHENSRRR
jgi:hypothetical protein